ncbi:hypothetical protein [Azohydromonas australica]|uniref:hypothetical protein n=1 Tax=Azohydromonas australica TaxID=364039 RepID=UPI0005B8E0A3|nr:hypothetical protein [Azohydromonas australica]
MTPRLSLLLVVLALAGCEQLGYESANTTATRREAESKAIGGACRHAGRAIEDCFTLNRKADKAAIFAGWREMNDYMRENSIQAVSPQLSATPPSSAAAAASSASAADVAEQSRPGTKARKS